jgi:hypothetical protein
VALLEQILPVTIQPKCLPEEGPEVCHKEGGDEVELLKLFLPVTIQLKCLPEEGPELYHQENWSWNCFYLSPSSPKVCQKKVQKSAIREEEMKWSCRLGNEESELPLEFRKPEQNID